jgi:hypothetical protein
MPVTWETIWLREPQDLAFPNGERFVVAVESADFDDLSVKFASGPELVLAGVIDADERFLWPRLHLFVGVDPTQLLFFGGPAAYRVRSDGHVLERLETQRDLADYECGSLDVITAGDIAVIVYEVGILVIDDDLRRRWLRRKYMNQHRVTLEDDAIWIREPHTIPIGHRLSDGELISAPEGYSPGVPCGRVLNQSELFAECVKAWNREAIISAFQAVALELAKVASAAQGGGDDRRQLDDLRAEVASQIAKMSREASARPDHGFAEGLAMRWRELGLDPKRLLGIATTAVYRWRVL